MCISDSPSVLRGVAGEGACREAGECGAPMARLGGEEGDPAQVAFRFAAARLHLYDAYSQILFHTVSSNFRAAPLVKKVLYPRVTNSTTVIAVHPRMASMIPI